MKKTKVKTCLEFFTDDLKKFKELCKENYSSVSRELNLYIRERVRGGKNV